MAISKCDYCLKEIQRFSCHITRFKHHYCSRECYRKAIRGKLRGPYSWFKGWCNFKGYIQMAFSHLTNEEKNLAKGMVTQRGYVLKHRLVMAKLLGRPLKSNELVHHKNRNRADNRPENLELMTKKTHGPLINVICSCPNCGYHAEWKKFLERLA